MKKSYKFLLALSLLTLPFLSSAQFSVDGQIIQRAEVRNGAGALIGADQSTAAFIAHRMRLQAHYEIENFKFYASIQDVRAWGSTPQAKTTDPFLSLHEAWTETSFGAYWRVKLGRQELNYDNVRFLGNLDWALQARAHDFGLVKYEKDQMKLHLGGGYNQDAQNLSGNIFFNPNQYKIAHFARYENSWGNFKLSAMLWNDGRQLLATDSLGELLHDQVNYRQTIGLPTVQYQWGNTKLNGFYYLQQGHDASDKVVNAFDIGTQITHSFFVNETKGNSFKATIGFEILSGTNSNITDKNNSFNPLYGTNHGHNGYMDLFYVGGRMTDGVGLQDYYMKGRYQFNPNLFTQVDAHIFNTQADFMTLNQQNNLEKMDAYLGTELDFSLGYLVNSAVSLQAGYSQIFASDTFKAMQGKPNYKNNQNWAYVMFIYRPTMKNKFSGILFY